MICKLSSTLMRVSVLGGWSKSPCSIFTVELSEFLISAFIEFKLTLEIDGDLSNEFSLIIRFGSLESSVLAFFKELSLSLEF